jgi:acetyl esterase/lipase
MNHRLTVHDTRWIARALVLLCCARMPAPLRAGEQALALWPELPLDAGASGEKVVERGNPGHPDRNVSAVTHPSLIVMIPAQQAAGATAMVICPGGGYAGLAIDKEGYEVARRLNASGIAAFILKYRMPGGRSPGAHEQPTPIMDVQRAIRMVRAGAGQWKIDAHKIGVMGFSAGGHVAGSAATQFDDGDPSARDQVDGTSSRPDFAVLLYPVVSMRDDVCHKGSRKNLLGESPDAQMIDRFSVELHLSRQSPPIFIVHARDDKAVPIANSQRLADAAERVGVDCKLVTLEKGGHGFGLGAADRPTGAWFDQMLQWLHAKRF